MIRHNSPMTPLLSDSSQPNSSRIRPKIWVFLWKCPKYWVEFSLELSCHIVRAHDTGWGHADCASVHNGRTGKVYAPNLAPVGQAVRSLQHDADCARSHRVPRLLR